MRRLSIMHDRISLNVFLFCLTFEENECNTANDARKRV